MKTNKDIICYYCSNKGKDCTCGWDPDIDRHLAEGIEWGSLFFILAFVLVGIALWTLTRLSEILYQKYYELY